MKTDETLPIFFPRMSREPWKPPELAGQTVFSPWQVRLCTRLQAPASTLSVADGWSLIFNCSPFVGVAPNQAASRGARHLPNVVSTPSAQTTPPSPLVLINQPAIESTSPASIPSRVGSCLSFFINQWKAIIALDLVCDIVRGISPEFDSAPYLMHLCSAPDSSKVIPLSKLNLLRREV